MIFGMIERYLEQNSSYDDYIHFAGKLYKRLLARGHDGATLRPLFLQAHHRARAKANTAPEPAAPDANDQRSLRRHLEYHPCDLPRLAIRRLFDAHCAPIMETLPFEPLTIAYSKPKSLGRYVTPTTLHEAPGLPASKYLGEHQQGLDP